jgi:hypothetical protein
MLYSRTGYHPADHFLIPSATDAFLQKQIVNRDPG